MARIPNAETDPIRLDFKKMRQRRRMLDISQADLAKAIGGHRNSISYFERGHRIPDALQLFYLARALGTPIHELVDAHDQNGSTVNDPWRGQRRRDPD